MSRTCAACPECIIRMDAAVDLACPQHQQCILEPMAPWEDCDHHDDDTEPPMSITEKELAEQLAIAASNSEPWSVVARRAAELLGVELADPKPAPGLYLHEDGRFVRVYGRGEQQDDAVSAYADTEWVAENRDKLTPARVVPAEPVELTEEQAGELWDAMDDPSVNYWLDFRGHHRAAITRAVNAALAKYGHGHTPALPDSEAVWQAIVNSRRSDGARLTATDATDAVMRLLHGDGAPTMPTRDQVAKAVASGYREPGPVATNVIDAVMALLEDGPR